MEATALLKKDHATVKGLFKKFEDAGDRAAQTKQRLFDEVHAELDAHAAIEEEIDAKMKVLQENVEHHADEEEEEMFPRAEEHLSDERRAELGQQIESRKKDLKAA